MAAFKFFLRKRHFYLLRLKNDIDFDKKSSFLKLIKKYSLQIEIKKNYSKKKNEDMHLIEIIQNHVHDRDEAENNKDHRKL